MDGKNKNKKKSLTQEQVESIACAVIKEANASKLNTFRKRSNAAAGLLDVVF